MKCKFCNAEMEEGNAICPVCGADNALDDITKMPKLTIPGREEPSGTEETQEQSAPEVAEQPVPKKKKKWKLAAAIAGCAVIAVVLAGAILYGAGIDLKPKANDIFRKDTYVVDAATAEKKKDTVVATLGDRQLTNAELKVYYEMNKGNFLSYYGSYAPMMGLDPSKPLSQQVQDPKTGLTWEQFFLKNSMESWQRYAVLHMLAQDENYTPTEIANEQMERMQQELKQIAENAGFASVQDMVTADLGPGATEEGYMNYMRTYYESLDYYDQVFARIQPTDEEVAKYYADNEAIFTKDKIDKTAGKYVDVRHILIAPEGGTMGENGQMEYTEEQWEAASQKAQETLDQWKSGEASESSFGKLATELTADGGSRNNGGLYKDVKVGQMVKPFEEWCFEESRQPGDTGIVKTNFGYHIMYFVEGKDIWKTEATSRLITERTEKMLQDGMERWPMEVSYSKICLGQAEQEKPAEPTAPATEAVTVPETTK